MSPTHRQGSEENPGGRLEPHKRVLCLLAPLTLGLLVFAALVVRPLAQRYSLLAHFFRQPCIFDTATGLPCPFCGLTRATVAACKNKWLLSLHYHPLGVVLVGGGAGVSLWLTACAALGRNLGIKRVYRLLNHRPVFWIVLAVLAAVWARQIWASIYVWPLPSP